MRQIIALLLIALAYPIAAQETTTAPEAKSIFEHTRAATVLILAGEGAGRLNSVATGVVISKDGVILTALHAIKGAAEVQIRTSSGDAYDNAYLVGSDERRDVAALKIAAGALTALAPATTSGLSQAIVFTLSRMPMASRGLRLKAFFLRSVPPRKSLGPVRDSGFSNSRPVLLRVPVAAHSWTRMDG
jgi:hypothetical protein